MMDADPPMAPGEPFDGVVLAGGGTRCFWQLGFWEAAAPALGLPRGLRTVAGVSAGAAMACAVLLGRGRETLEIFKAACAGNKKNAYLANVLTSGARVFPHEAMYRAAVLEVVGAQGLERLKQGPDLRVFYGLPPRRMGAIPGLLWGLGCYLWEKRAGDPVLGDLARRAGLSGRVESVRSCRTPDDLVDLILASSCTPPFTPAMRRGGRAVIDGSVVDSAPLGALTGDERRVLVLLSRSYGTMPPPDPARVFVGPSRKVPLSKWDYTNPEGLQRAYDLGMRDGEAFVKGRGPEGRSAQRPS